jgi:iron-sulfur cluster assembly protein
MLTVTDKAIDVIRDVCKGDVRGLRIMVQKGCSGLTYSMGLEDEATDDDRVIEVDDVTLFVDPGSALWLTGATMDYVDQSAMGSGFVFDNPNAPPPPKGCSCSAGTCG